MGLVQATKSVQPIQSFALLYSARESPVHDAVPSALPPSAAQHVKAIGRAFEAAGEAFQNEGPSEWLKPREKLKLAHHPHGSTARFSAKTRGLLAELTAFRYGLQELEHRRSSMNRYRGCEPTQPQISTNPMSAYARYPNL